MGAWAGGGGVQGVGGSLEDDVAMLKSFGGYLEDDVAMLKIVGGLGDDVAKLEGRHMGVAGEPAGDAGAAKGCGGE